VQDETQTNHTLDASPSTFPLDRSLYADFTHDDEIAAIVAALGLFRQPAFLDPTRPDPRRTWRASTIVPFSSRIVVERLSCVVRPGLLDSKSTKETRVRILVQDEVQPLGFCGADSRDGVCTLEAFVKSQSFARSGGGGVFQQCFNSIPSAAI
jgi:hypothetical protein